MSAQRDADVVVVGAGTGGLTAAAFLAVAGRRVVVVDQGWVPGGCGSVFTRNGYDFDVGLHYLGSDHDGSPAPQRMLEPLGIRLEYNRLDPVDRILLPDSTFDVPTGIEVFRERLYEALPDEREAVDGYLGLIETLEAGVAGLGRFPGITSLPTSMWRTGNVLRHLRTTVGSLFDDLKLSPRARTLLGWISGVYAVPPSEASLLMHAVVTMHYLNGAWFPRGGGAVISEALADVVRANGGEFVMQHEVERILTHEGRAAGVEARGKDGSVEQIAATSVISAVDIKRTFLDLLDPQDVPLGLRRKIRGYEMSLPLGILYVIIDRDLAAEGAPVTNWLVAPDDDLEGMYRRIQSAAFADKFTLWLTSSSLKDPGNRRLCGPGQTNLQLITPVPGQDRAWGLQAGVERGEEYQRVKQLMRDRLLGLADRAFPGLSESVVYDEVATPYTLRRYLGCTDGTSYGIAATPDQMAMGRPGPKTHIEGLFLAGASTRDGHGITGVMRGGISAASAILGTSAVKVAREREPVAAPA